MKKILFIIALSIVHFCTHAQNYKCLQADSLRYYINSYGYLRAIHLDSVRTSGTDTVYYPFHTSRGPYLTFQILDTNGGSWVGKNVIEQQDGTFLFDNWWQDTVVIKSQATTGDSWTFYDDSSTHYYKAEITAIDTMTVLGALDSVKHILITAYDSTTPAPTDSLNNFEIILSKEHGFAQVFDLYMFPYHRYDTVYYAGQDFYLDNSMIPAHVYPWAGAPPGIYNCIFKATQLIIPTDSEMYDWNPGDNFQYNYQQGFQDIFAQPIYNPMQIWYYNIIQKYFTASTPNFVYDGWQALCCDPNYVHYHIDSIGADTAYNGVFAANGVMIPYGVIPENRQEYFYYFFPMDTSFCLTSNKYITSLNDFSITSAQVNTFEPGALYSIYKEGIGITDWNMWDFADGSGWGNHLLYYNKNGDSCGHFTYPDTTHIVVSTATVTQENTLKIYPNPTDEILHIQLSKNTSGASYTTLYNMMGQKVYSSEGSSNQYAINTKDIPAGIYNLQIRSDKAAMINRTIIITH